ncbi:uncharacterized protein LOC143700866 isoform X2 [Siphateles boraxobius]|uniref:uncharacterized protein LOC143700866 isoform X2 n=1 Tax=Siphateles boraxobius TaxID=180520 RepID=UPI004062F432
MKSRQTYDKVFQSIWGASGGWSVILCPHGIVYSIKFNLRAESPRDFADLLLSWKHFPNVCVYDFARGLATHTNFRVPHSLPFQPFEGRLSDPTEENVKAARYGKLLVSLPWLHESVHCGENNAHPVTGSSEHYVLYERFHEQNATDPKDILRRIQLVPELKGWLNSQVAEQFFAKMRKSNYFFNNMTPSTHAFLMRSVIHRHNTSTNRALLERQLNSGCRLELLNTITLSTLGQAVIGDASKRRSTIVVAQASSATRSQLTPAEPRSTESIAAQPPTDEAQTQNVGPSHHCGQYCATLTAISNLRPCRTMWSAGGDHPLQEQLVSYVLDEGRPANEIMIKDGPTCLTRENLLSLGLNREMDSMVGNACLRLVKEMVELQGKKVFIMDLHIPPTWLPPLSCDPLGSLPVDSAEKDALIFPLWTQGHFLLCVMMPGKRRILFLDSLFAQWEQGFGNKAYRDILRAVAQKLMPGPWEEQSGLDVEGLPLQHYGIDCGLFMVMYTWYITVEAAFDFTTVSAVLVLTKMFNVNCGESHYNCSYLQSDMQYLRSWWCKVLLKNLEIEGHGRRFAHFTQEGRKMGDRSLPPVFRVLRKRRYSTLVPTIPAKMLRVSQDGAVATDILQLPDDILQRILVFVVLQYGCSAIPRLALTCQRLNNIVSQEHFQQEAHFSWLDSVVNWKRLSERHRQMYRKPYTISICRRLQCSQLYKDCGAGYQGNGQRGVLLGFYSSDDNPGYCSWDCFLDDGGLEQ